MNIKIRRQKSEDRSQTSCLRRLKPTATHCSLLIAHCFLSLTLTLTLTLSHALAQELPYTVKRITDGRSMDYNPEFSPDGKQIVFVSKTENTEKIKKGEFWHKTPFYLNLWLIDSDGKNRRQLTSGEVQDFAPRWTPDGKKVIFVSNSRGNQGDVWSINTDGSNLNRIAEIEGDTGQWRTLQYPVLTPDGKGLVFMLYRKESISGVWFMDIESRNMRRITSGGNGDYFPVVSPDGKEIVFETMRLGIGDIWSTDISGKNYKRLTYENYPELYPAYSHDGTKISYVANKEGIIDIWIMDRDGKHRKRVTKNILKEVWGRKWLSMFNYNDLFDAGYYHVSWHPDGTKLALTTWEPDKKESYLTILDFKEDISKVIDNLPEEKKNLSDYTLIGEKDLTGGGDWDDFGPSFSPDGKTIIFASNRKGNWNIWSIGIDGVGLKQLTNGDDDELAPVYSPDGKEIAFLKSSKELLSAYDIWVMKSDGSGARQVTEGFKVISYPAWNPQSNEIAFVSKEDKGPEIQLISLSKVGQEVVNTVSRVISMWDTQKPNPVMFPFAKEEEQREFNPHKIMKMKKMVQEENKNERKVWSEELLLLKKIFEIPYPLEEFLYKIDYNTTGDRLIFESNQTGNINIWSVKRDGTGLTHLTKGDGTYLNPVFSPNNSKVAYTRKLNRRSEFDYNTSESYDIWIADVDTGEEMRINDEEQTDWNPVFSPDGKKIAYVTNRSGDFEHYNIWLLYLK